MNLYVVGGAIAGTVLLMTGTFFAGDRHGYNRCEKAHAAAALERAKDIEEKKHEAGKESVRRSVATIQLNRQLGDEVAAYVRSDVRARAACFDADELRLVRAIAERQLPDVQPGAVPR